MQHVNDLAFRIDLESTLTLSEAMYQQISGPEVTEKLPNKLRVILGLPEREEPLNENIEIVDGEAASSSRSSPQNSTPKAATSSTSRNSGGAGDTVSTSDSRGSRDSSMERHYDSGNQFM